MANLLLTVFLLTILQLVIRSQCASIENQRRLESEKVTELKVKTGEDGELSRSKRDDDDDEDEDDSSSNEQSTPSSDDDDSNDHDRTREEMKDLRERMNNLRDDIRNMNNNWNNNPFNRFNDWRRNMPIRDTDFLTKNCSKSVPIFSPLCASNGKSYVNRYAFNCAKRKNPDLQLVHKGECKDDTNQAENLPLDFQP